MFSSPFFIPFSSACSSLFVYITSASCSSNGLNFSSDIFIIFGTATLIIDGVEYSAEVHNGTATFIDVILPKSSTTAILRYGGNEYYAPSESTFDIKINASESVNNQTASSENEIKKSVNYSVDSKQTGNPIVIALLVLMCLVSNNILRRKR